MNVEFVRAGAGSGKTHYLTQLLAQRLKDGAARPHAVLATTFTVKAASELRERARARLLKEGRLDLSAAIGQAKIGTINSVCGQLIKRFCFELGISPDQTVLDEHQGKQLVGIAIESVQSPLEVQALMDLGHRFSIGSDDRRAVNTEQKRRDALTATIGAVIDAARSNDLSADDVWAMGPRNADAMLACWPTPTGHHTAALLEALLTALPQLQAVQAAGNTTAVLAKGIDQVQQAIQGIARGTLAWSDWHKLAGVEAGAKQRPMLVPVQDVARLHDSHVGFHDDIRQYLSLVFELAARALQAFADAKRELGVVDFNDQEVMLLRALKDSDLVRQALREELDLVLVDEFQDTNPLQLAIFVELAKLAKASVWVGDQKQAIYGFRGTDSSLIQQILSSVREWGGTLGAPLTQSWRSTAPLVELANQVFVPAFAPAAPADITLTAQRPALEGPNLLNWSFVLPKGKRALDVTALGPAVTQLLDRGLQIQDKVTGEPRPLRPDDVAILCRSNKTVRDAVAALGRWGIPAAAESPGLLDTPECQLVLACLRRMHDPEDTVASALIVSLSDAEEPVEWLQDRLSFLAKLDMDEQEHPRHARSSWKVEGEGAHPLLAHLHAERGRLLSMTPHEALRFAKARSGVARLAHQWSGNDRSAQVRIANVEALLMLGREYEQLCLNSRKPATINGLLLHLADLADKAMDGRAAAAYGAVEIMTCHGAKGLEWPVVIVLGLNHGHRTDLWNVRARTEGAFDAQKPLARRFIHCWPYPYGASSDVPATQTAEDSQAGLHMAEEARRENCRLLYVTLTRARDMVVLVGATKDADEAPARDWLDEVGASDKLWGHEGTREINGVQLRCERAAWDPAEASAAPPARPAQVLQFFEPGAPKKLSRLWYAPSSIKEREGAFKVATIEDVGARIAVQPGTDFESLGSAIHACIACATIDPVRGLNEEEIEQILRRWSVYGSISPAAVQKQITAFTAWWRARWPDATPEVEVPVEARMEDGSIIRGQIDLLLKVGAGRVLIDHKSDPRGAGVDDRLARAHGGQLEAYAYAVQLATKEQVTERWLFLPVSAKAVRIEAASQAAIG
ncbi:exodeoxyribonuclease V subunit beta [Polaromonas sp.]|uniref:UvrD-helicase domain-containing protein n=1 Tax=Polaromonas sp. TaxID=1869339 RepID=UPI002731E18F|nr:UvrD-helicase domain-containing protein [Polaromonas sp.]MDP1740964.1 UvrD-helicase domain-containing protein [Polaromonas sp.]